MTHVPPAWAATSRPSGNDVVHERSVGQHVTLQRVDEPGEVGEDAVVVLGEALTVAEAEQLVADVRAALDVLRGA